MSGRPHRYYTPGNEPATDAQIHFLGVLLRKAFAIGAEHSVNLDEHHLGTTRSLTESGGKRYASECIEALKKAIAAKESR